MAHKKAEKIKIGDSVYSKDGYIFTVNRIGEKQMRQILKSILCFTEQQQLELM